MTQTTGEEQAAKGKNLADLLSEPEGAPVHVFGPGTWIKIGIVAALFLVVHFWQLRILGSVWTTPDWQHGWAIPLFALYLLYVRRKDILAACRPIAASAEGLQKKSRFSPQAEILAFGFLLVLFAIPLVLIYTKLWSGGGGAVLEALWASGSWGRRAMLVLLLVPAAAATGFFHGLYRWKNLGLPIIIFAIIMQVLGFYPISNGYTYHTGMVLLLFGVVLYLGGRRLAYVTALPIWFLMFAMPLPATIHNEIAFALQNYAAAGSEAVLRAFGVQLTAASSAMDITSVGGNIHHLTVAEACSGIRSLMAYPALCVAFTYLEYRPIWQRLILILAIVPVTIVVNIGRVSLTAAMFVWDKPEWGKDFMHEVLGMVMLIPTLLVMMGILWVLNRVYVDSEDDEPQQAQAETSQEAKAV